MPGPYNKQNQAFIINVHTYIQTVSYS